MDQAAATPNGRHPVTDALEDRELKAVTHNRLSSDHPIWSEPYPRRVRAFLDGVAVVDSTRALLLLEARHLPVYYFPPQDVRTDLLEPTDTSTHCPYKGDACYWSIRVGNQVTPDAVWSYQDPLPGREDIKGYLAFYWNRLDAWFEEDDEVFVHPRDPYHRWMCSQAPGTSGWRWPGRPWPRAAGRGCCSRRGCPPATTCPRRTCAWTY